jgi:tRNA nucleotidyltransferase (CCA-adding enzyme)
MVAVRRAIMRPMDRRRAPDLLAHLDAIPAGRQLRERLRAAAVPAHLVGGAVRDLLLERPPEDLDLVVEGELEAVVSLLGPPRRVHDRFGTCTVHLSGVRCDIARARSERYERPGALPEVAPAGIAEDLARRDFTVNTLALTLTGERAGELLSVADAESDLAARTLRVLHDSSFEDDPTRVLRLARYAGRLSFAIAPGTRSLAQAAVRERVFETVSGGRIGSELRLAAADTAAIAEFRVLRELGADEALESGFGIGDPELAARARELAGAAGDDGVAAACAVLAVALGGVPEPRRAPLLDRLAFTAPARDAILAAARLGPGIALGLEQAGGVPSRIALAVGAAGPATVALAGALGPAAAARSWLTRLRHVRLQITGDDLIAAGVRPGPAVGAGLAAARAATLDGRTPDRGSQLGEALRVAAATG